MRKNNFLLLLIILFIFCIYSKCISEEIQKPLEFTLEDSIKISLENSLDLSSADQEIIKSEARINQAETGRYPLVSAKAYYSRLYPVQTFNFGGGEEENGESEEGSEIQLGEPDQAQLTFTFNYNIYDGSLTSNLVDQTTLVLESTKYDRESIRQNVIYKVIENYYNVLMAQSLLKVAEKTLAATEEQLKRAQAFYEEGIVPRADVTSAEAQVANAQLAIISANKGIEMAKAVLKDTMNISLDSEINLLYPAESKTYEVDPVYTNELASKNRAEIKKMIFLSHAAAMQIEVAKSQNRPTIYFNFDYIPLSSTTFNPSNSLTATVGASFPIFDRGLTTYKIEEAEASLQQSIIATKQVEKGVTLEVKQAYLEYLEACEKLDQVQINLKAATENHDIAVLRYQEGIAPYIEVSDSIVTLARAEVDNVLANYDYFMAKAGLVKSAGLLPEDGDIDKIKLFNNKGEEDADSLIESDRENEF